jgi:hypothetical protein
MFLHAGEAKTMCTTFNHMDFGNVSIFQANGAGLSSHHTTASIGSNSFGNQSSY